MFQMLLTCLICLWDYTSFNEDISLWDVGNVTDTTSMFHEATNFIWIIISWHV